MKVKVLHTISTIISKDYVSTFNSLRHSIEHVKEPNGFLIDKTTFIPYHNVREVVIELNEIKLQPITMITNSELDELPEDNIDGNVWAKEVLSKDKSKKSKKVG